MIHQTDSTGLSKGQSKLVDEAYDETGTWAEFKESSKPQPVDFMNGDTPTKWSFLTSQGHTRSYDLS